MAPHHRGDVFGWLAAGAGLAAGAYATYVALTWRQYGHPPPPRPGDDDPLLDRFIPKYDVVERHHVRVPAPAAATLAAAREMDLSESPLVRGIFRGRELLLGGTPGTESRPRGLLAECLSLGWLVLAEVRDREIVVGSVTRPWEPNVRFRPIPADAFAAFEEPNYVKIVWTLLADPIDEATSIFRTETRALATDAAARARFRRYWAFLSPGIIVIRRLMTRGLRSRLERGARSSLAAMPPSAPPRA